jgi:hypothetical protein
VQHCDDVDASAPALVLLDVGQGLVLRQLLAQVVEAGQGKAGMFGEDLLAGGVELLG